MRSFDVIVAGAGGMGTAAAAHLARRGASVLALDRFPSGHARGSSHGQTRLIRLAYFEHPDYVPLLRRARELWRILEHDSGAPLLTEPGLPASPAPPQPPHRSGARYLGVPPGIPMPAPERIELLCGVHR
jgi:sarcosine oxidase